MDILLIFKAISFLLVVGLIVFGWGKIKDIRTKQIFITMMFLFLLSAVLFFPHGYLKLIFGNEALDWLKHILFYVGQLFFYFFIARIIRLNAISFSKKIKTNIVEEVNTMLFSGAAFIVFSIVVGFGGVNIVSDTDNISLSHWLKFLYDNGIVHILVLPFLFLIISAIKIKYLYIESKVFKSALNLFILAAAFFTMIHISEFLIENQKLLPINDPKGEFIEMVEFIWFYAGLFIFSLALRKFNQLNINNDVKRI